MAARWRRYQADSGRGVGRGGSEWPGGGIGFGGCVEGGVGRSGCVDGRIRQGDRIGFGGL